MSKDLMMLWTGSYDAVLVGFKDFFVGSIMFPQN
ncbi:hypothetical protein C8K36_101762 [Rhodococcus sp. OK519]|nr:hypothetical protein C8K36_101762 [Rhodococcus sp. OK519]